MTDIMGTPHMKTAKLATDLAPLYVVQLLVDHTDQLQPNDWTDPDEISFVYLTVLDGNEPPTSGDLNPQNWDLSLCAPF